MDTVAEPLRILCLSPDRTIAAGVAAMFASVPDFTLATRTVGYDEGLRDLREPDLAVVVLEEDPTQGIAVIEGVRRASRNTYVVAVSVEDDADTIVRAMRAGADEHLSLPLSQQDLFKTCIKVIELRRGRASQNGRTDGRHGELWVAYGPKGGVGVTTLVVNLAVALQAQRDVAIVDLDVYSGDAALFLNVRPSYTLRHVVETGHLDSVFLRGAMGRHGSGVSILAAPAAGRGEPPLALTAEQTVAILGMVTGMHELTLVDTPGIPSEATRAALGAADRILLVTELTVPAIHGCVRTLDWLRGEGVDPATTVDVIANRHDSRSAEVSPKDASKTLGLPLRALLPRDDVAALAAANAGKPLGEVKPGGILEQAIAELAGPKPTAADASRRRPGFLRLFTT